MAEAAFTDDIEIWKPVVGYEEYYEVSSLGRIKRLGRWVNARSGGKRFWPEEIINCHRNSRGYVTLRMMGKHTEVHRVVCAAFHGPKPTPKHHAAHANDIKDDNRPENLRWATPKENAADRLRNNLQARGEAISTGKLTEAQVLEIRANYTGKYGQIKKMAQFYGVKSQPIIQIIKRRSWTHI